MKREEIINRMQEIAPESWKAEWDNVGLQVGMGTGSIRGVLLALDPTPDVIREAKAKDCGLIITHHPLIFKPLKSLTPDTSGFAAINLLLKNDISLYVSHTNLDVAPLGVNYALAAKLGLENLEVLHSWETERLLKLAVFVPEDHVEDVRVALGNAGAGAIGEYSHCTFSAPGTGTFKPGEGSNPFIGSIGELERVAEQRVETVFPERILPRVMQTLFSVHPYEEVAYDLYPLVNRVPGIGLGRIGTLPRSITFPEFRRIVEKALDTSSILALTPKSSGDVQRIAVCSGSGGSMVEQAAKAKADVFVTGELDYHDGQRAAELGIGVIAAGHYQTETPVLDHLVDLLSEDHVKRRILISRVVADSLKK